MGMSMWKYNEKIDIAKYIEWIELNVKDPIPLNDKSRLPEMIDILSNPTSSIVEIDTSLKSIGMMSMRYGSSFIFMCDLMPLIHKHLLSNNIIIVSQCIRTLKYISQYGGCDNLKDEVPFLQQIYMNPKMDFFIRDEAMKTYGFVVGNITKTPNPTIIQ